MIWLIASLALAGGGKWADRDSNIVAEGTVDAAPEQIYRFLLQREALERILPDDCATDFSYDRTSDPEAAVRLTYHAAAWARRLDAVLEKSSPQRVVQYDHPGNKGFATRFTLEPAEQGTRVEMTTYIKAPPWPFRKYYYTRVRPAWAQCYHDAIEALDRQVEGDEAPPAGADPSSDQTPSTDDPPRTDAPPADD